MINQQTVQKLQEMRLNAMAGSFKQQLSDKEFYNLSFDERFGLIIDYEWSRRKNNALQRLIKNADFRMPNASIEDIEYHADRNLSKEQILRLSSCNYIQEKRNLIITGASGNGNPILLVPLGLLPVETSIQQNISGYRISLMNWLSLVAKVFLKR